LVLVCFGALRAVCPIRLALASHIRYERRGMQRVVELVAGARPNFMKIAPILRELSARPGPLLPRVVHTGQHYDASMSDVFFSELGIPKPDVYLGVGSGNHGAQTARILAAYEEHLLSLNPRPVGVVVVGDVNSTMACTLAAVKLGIPVAHVEAGLRSFDRTMPEEINRIVTDALADLLLVSEPSGQTNLLREGISAEKIKLVGNVMIDTLVSELAAARKLETPTQLGCDKPYAFVTLHRPSNVDDADRLAEIVGLLERLGTLLGVVFPVHPRTRGRLEEFGLSARLESAPRVRLFGPLGYRESLGLMAEASVVITDSGGIQEETAWLRVPCLTVRPNTERPITVERGTSTLVGDDLSRIEPLVLDILEGRYKRGQPIDLWDGHAAERVVSEIVAAWG
jgi:UDP-N-acetylglucosamine 2-epimerase (non-hydrolysing)